MTYLVQSVIFDKSKFSLENARTWLHENKYKDKGVDEKKKMWRFRQLNPLTIKRKGFSHYITKPLDNSGVELIIAYKEKMEGAGKLNQIKKALFTHFKKDEALESKVASTLGRVNKEANDIVTLLEQHDKVDDKPQAQIKQQLSKLDNNNIFGKGFKEKSSIYSKDKMTNQEAKLYMSGILTTGGSLDLSQDVAFRLKYSFNVRELRKMLKELLKEKKIELTIKEINKLKKDEIIDMAVKGQLITPPALPTSVALAKKYKMADLKREVLKHAGLGEFKKADIINYIEKNKLFEIEEQPNIQLSIEEKVEEAPIVKKSKKPRKKLILEEDVEIIEEEPKLVESEPTGNPKLNMKGIQMGTREMPKEEYVKPDITDEEWNVMKRDGFSRGGRKGRAWDMGLQVHQEAYKNMKDGKIPLHIGNFTLVDKRVYVANPVLNDTERVKKLIDEFNRYIKAIKKHQEEKKEDIKSTINEEYVKPDITDEEFELMKRNKFWHFIEFDVPFKTMKDGKIPLHYFLILNDKPQGYTLVDKRVYVEDYNVDNKKKIDIEKQRFNQKLEEARIRFAKIDNPQPELPKKSKKVKTETPVSKPAPKVAETKVAEPVVDEAKNFIVKQYMEKGYNKDEAEEAYQRDIDYQNKINEKRTKEGKYLEDVLNEEKPLTKKEKGDILEKKYFEKTWKDLSHKLNEKDKKELSVKYSTFIQQLMEKNPKMTLPIAKQVAFGGFRGFNRKYNDFGAILYLNKIRKDEHYLVDDLTYEFVLPDYKA